MKAMITWWHKPVPYNCWGVIGIAFMGQSIAYATMGKYGTAVIFAALWTVMLIVNGNTQSS